MTRNLHQTFIIILMGVLPIYHGGGKGRVLARKRKKESRAKGQKIIKIQRFLLLCL
jgi:hypothetical protein